MQAANWPQEHSDELRHLLALGLSYSQIAAALNARFNTAYSRNATLGRARRLGLMGLERPPELPKRKARQQRHKRPRPPTATSKLPRPVLVESKELVRLRCVEIDPRHLSFMELEGGDCRYPYGGDAEGEAITFCGHSQRAGSSYCTAHFHLTRGPGTASERAAVTVALRLVQAA